MRAKFGVGVRPEIRIRNPNPESTPSDQCPNEETNAKRFERCLSSGLSMVPVSPPDDPQTSRGGASRLSLGHVISGLAMARWAQRWALRAIAKPGDRILNLTPLQAISPSKSKENVERHLSIENFAAL
jgi:hypothetical protein